MQNFSPDQISQLAYQLWQERGCPDGSPEVDWERAVRLLEEPSALSNGVLSAPTPSAPPAAATRNQTGANARSLPNGQLEQGKARTPRNSSV